MPPPRKFKVTQKTKLPVLRESYDERALYPWMNIRTEYIEGFEDDDGTWQWPSVRELAARFDMPEKPLQNRMAKERWLEYRKAHQNQITLERQKEHAKRLAGKAVKFDEKASDTAMFGMDLIFERLQELQELKAIVEQNRQLAVQKVEDGEWVPPAQLKASAISGAELESLAKAASMFTEAGHKALGIKDGENIQLTQNNVEINQTNVRDELLRRDEDRVKEFLRIVQNKNFSVPQSALGQQPEEDDEEVIEADLVEDEYEDGFGESD